MKVIYIAGPYSGKNSWDVEQNIRRAEALGFQVAEAGASPIIVHSAFRFWSSTLTYKFWMQATRAQMLKCDAVLMTPDWKNSPGATDEHTVALDNNKPVLYSYVVAKALPGYDIDQLKAWLKENP